MFTCFLFSFLHIYHIVYVRTVYSILFRIRSTFIIMTLRAFQQLPNPCVDLGGGGLAPPPSPTNFKHIKNHPVKFSKMNLGIPLIKKTSF